MLMPVTPIVGPNCRDLVYMSHTPTLARITITTETNLPKWTCETCTNGQSLSVTLTVTVRYGRERYRAVVANVSVDAHSDFSKCAGRRTANPGQSGENHGFHPDLVHARNRFKRIRERDGCKFRRENRADDETVRCRRHDRLFLFYGRHPADKIVIARLDEKSS